VTTTTLANPCSSFIGILLVLVLFVIVVSVVFEFVVGNGVGRAIDGGGKFGIDVVGFFLVFKRKKKKPLELEVKRMNFFSSDFFNFF